MGSKVNSEKIGNEKELKHNGKPTAAGVDEPKRYYQTRRFWVVVGLISSSFGLFALMLFYHSLTKLFLEIDPFYLLPVFIIVVSIVSVFTGLIQVKAKWYRNYSFMFLILLLIISPYILLNTHSELLSSSESAIISEHFGRFAQTFRSTGKLVGILDHYQEAIQNYDQKSILEYQQNYVMEREGIIRKANEFVKATEDNHLLLRYFHEEADLLLKSLVSIDQRFEELKAKAGELK